MSAIAERLVVRLTAAAKRHPITRLVLKAIRRNHPDPTSQLQFFRIFDKADRDR